MVQYKDGRFYMYGISFLLPNGFYINDRIEVGDSMEFLSSEDGEISIYCSIEGSSAEEAISFDKEDFFDEYTFYEAPHPFAYNGFKGYYRFYATDIARQYLDVCFQIEEGDEKAGKDPSVLFMQIRANEEIHQFAQSAFLREFIGSVRRETEKTVPLEGS